MNDSSTGGFLAPTSTFGLEGQALIRQLQQLVAGITGLPGSSVLQRWQPEPATYPPLGTDWAAVGRGERTGDTFPYLRHSSTQNQEQGADILHRTEVLEVRCSFYGPNADQHAEDLKDGLFIAQNLEQLQLLGMGLVDAGPLLTVPIKLQGKWQYQVDITFRLRRAQVRTYPVLNLVGASAIQALDDSGAVDDTTTVGPGSGRAPLPLFAWGLSSSVYAGWGQGNW